MLVDLIKQGVLDKRSILLRYGWKVGLNSNQLLIVLLIMELSEENKKIIASNELAEYISLSADKIDSEIDKIINKKLVTISSKSIDFTNLFVKIMDHLSAEYSDFNNNRFIKNLNANLESKVGLDEIGYLTDRLKHISKDEILGISQDENVKNYQDLISVVEKEYKKKVKQITKYNWLDD